MFFCSLIEELCTKEENDKTACNFNFGHECIYFRVINPRDSRRIFSQRKMEKYFFILELFSFQICFRQ